MDYKRAEQICDQLIEDIGKLSRAEVDYLEVLSELMAKYEMRWEREIAQMDPRQLVQYLMEENNLAQNDMVSEFRSPSRVSEFLNGKRDLSLNQAKNLAKRFKLMLSALVV
jgi:HTH-type transcriptional regulator/antitoxin HigA